ncbi:hypothetical protein [Psychromonas sp. SP041]|uniref:hypothetical protein n=1 Tax=Psychromonas sp. SP041 TaxID=1365007 RepID=UPI00042648F6|nr:hypothetical protein [Psychromonas sp. SP041]
MSKQDQKPFNIPAIDNQKEALAKYLKIDTDIVGNLEKIIRVSVKWPEQKFEVDGKFYIVSSSQSGHKDSETVSIQFNSNLWLIVIL